MSNFSHSQSNGSEHGDEHGTSVVPTIPLGLSFAADDIPHNAPSSDTNSANDDLLPSATTQKNRRDASVSRVDIGHFDPVGVDELRQTISHNASRVQLGDAGELMRQISNQSDATLTAGDGPIDLEKRLRTVAKK
jgi:ATP-binding cassette subfamily G (WHITE) protein 2 (SNQ2)